MARPAVLLVQCALYASRTRTRGGNDRRVAGSHGRAHARAQPHCERLATAAARPGGGPPSVRERRRRPICTPRIQAHTRPALRRPRRPPLSDRDQRAEASDHEVRRFRVRAGARVGLESEEPEDATPGGSCEMTWSMDDWEYLERQVIRDPKGRDWTIALMDMLGQQGDPEIPSRVLET